MARGPPAVMIQTILESRSELVVLPLLRALLLGKPEEVTCLLVIADGIARTGCDEPGWLNGGTFTSILLDASIRGANVYFTVAPSAVFCIF